MCCNIVWSFQHMMKCYETFGTLVWRSKNRKLQNCMYPRTCVFNVHVPLEYFHTCIFTFFYIYCKYMFFHTKIVLHLSSQQIPSTSSDWHLWLLWNLHMDHKKSNHQVALLDCLRWSTCNLCQMQGHLHTKTSPSEQLGLQKNMLLCGAGWGKTRNRLPYIYEYVAHIRCFLF